MSADAVILKRSVVTLNAIGDLLVSLTLPVKLIQNAKITLAISKSQIVLASANNWKCVAAPGSSTNLI